jgi:predicted enzyme related to lactoylglutathione lyase
VAQDWARPVVHWELVARDPDAQADFYRKMFGWDIGEGDLKVVPAGLGGPEPGPAGHILGGDPPGFVLYVQVRDIRQSLALAAELGADVKSEPFDVPTGQTIAFMADPEGNRLTLVQQ